MEDASVLPKHGTSQGHPRAQGLSPGQSSEGSLGRKKKKLQAQTSNPPIIHHHHLSHFPFSLSPLHSFASPSSKPPRPRLIPEPKANAKAKAQGPGPTPTLPKLFHITHASMQSLHTPPSSSSLSPEAVLYCISVLRSSFRFPLSPTFSCHLPSPICIVTPRRQTANCRQTTE